MSLEPTGEKKKIETDGVFNADKANAINYIIDEFKLKNQLTDFPQSMFKVITQEATEKDIIKHRVVVNKPMVEENISQLEAQVVKLKDLLTQLEKYEQPAEPAE